MKVGAMIRAFVCVLAASFPLMAFAGPAPDTDGDGVPDVLDNCSSLANASPNDCDTDADGYGNACDGDFNNSLNVDGTDFNPTFLADFSAGADSGVGTDMDCSGNVDGTDFNPSFLNQFTQGAPGPSGLNCAGTTPCQ